MVEALATGDSIPAGKSKLEFVEEKYGSKYLLPITPASVVIRFFEPDQQAVATNANQFADRVQNLDSSVLTSSGIDKTNTKADFFDFSVSLLMPSCKDQSNCSDKAELQALKDKTVAAVSADAVAKSADGTTDKNPSGKNFYEKFLTELKTLGVPTLQEVIMPHAIGAATSSSTAKSSALLFSPTQSTQVAAVAKPQVSAILDKDEPQPVVYIETRGVLRSLAESAIADPSEILANTGDAASSATTQKSESEILREILEEVGQSAAEEILPQVALLSSEDVDGVGAGSSGSTTSGASTSTGAGAEFGMNTEAYYLAHRTTTIAPDGSTIIATTATPTTTTAASTATGNTTDPTTTSTTSTSTTTTSSTTTTTFVRDPALAITKVKAKLLHASLGKYPVGTVPSSLVGKIYREQHFALTFDLKNVTTKRLGMIQEQLSSDYSKFGINLRDKITTYTKNPSLNKGLMTKYTLHDMRNAERISTTTAVIDIEEIPDDTKYELQNDRTYSLEPSAIDIELRLDGGDLHGAETLFSASKRVRTDAIAAGKTSAFANPESPSVWTSRKCLTGEFFSRDAYDLGEDRVLVLKLALPNPKHGFTGAHKDGQTQLAADGTDHQLVYVFNSEYFSVSKKAHQQGFFLQNATAKAITSGSSGGEEFLTVSTDADVANKLTNNQYWATRWVANVGEHGNVTYHDTAYGHPGSPPAFDGLLPASMKKIRDFFEDTANKGKIDKRKNKLFLGVIPPDSVLQSMSTSNYKPFNGCILSAMVYNKEQLNNPPMKTAPPRSQKIAQAWLDQNEKEIVKSGGVFPALMKVGDSVAYGMPTTTTTAPPNTVTTTTTAFSFPTISVTREPDTVDWYDAMAFLPDNVGGFYGGVCSDSSTEDKATVYDKICDEADTSIADCDSTTHDCWEKPDALATDLLPRDVLNEIVQNPDYTNNGRGSGDKYEPHQYKRMNLGSPDFVYEFVRLGICGTANYGQYNSGTTIVPDYLCNEPNGGLDTKLGVHKFNKVQKRQYIFRQCDKFVKTNSYCAGVSWNQEPDMTHASPGYARPYGSMERNMNAMAMPGCFPRSGGGWSAPVGDISGVRSKGTSGNVDGGGNVCWRHKPVPYSPTLSKFGHWYSRFGTNKAGSGFCTAQNANPNSGSVIKIAEKITLGECFNLCDAMGADCQGISMDKRTKYSHTYQGQTWSAREDSDEKRDCFLKFNGKTCQQLKQSNTGPKNEKITCDNLPAGTPPINCPVGWQKRKPDPNFLCPGRYGCSASTCCEESTCANNNGGKVASPTAFDCAFYGATALEGVDPKTIRCGRHGEGCTVQDCCSTVTTTTTASWPRPPYSLTSRTGLQDIVDHWYNKDLSNYKGVREVGDGRGITDRNDRKWNKCRQNVVLKGELTVFEISVNPQDSTKAVVKLNGKLIKSQVTHPQNSFRWLGLAASNRICKELCEKDVVCTGYQYFDVGFPNFEWRASCYAISKQFLKRNSIAILQSSETGIWRKKVYLADCNGEESVKNLVFAKKKLYQHGSCARGGEVCKQIFPPASTGTSTAVQQFTYGSKPDSEVFLTHSKSVEELQKICKSGSLSNTFIHCWDKYAQKAKGDANLLSSSDYIDGFKSVAKGKLAWGQNQTPQKLYHSSQQLGKYYEFKGRGGCLIGG
ncbi:unnamed protein product, partial [Amoebophrya sp. A120]|eukprot:GSA120T00010154001.1